MRCWQSSRYTPRIRKALSEMALRYNINIVGGSHPTRMDDGDIHNVAYALSAYPFGRLSDRMRHSTLLALGLLMLIGADLAFAAGIHWTTLSAGLALWGLHMGMTQGLLARMVADTAPPTLRGTAYGFFNLTSGLAMLAASALAGLLWETQGATWTFLAGAIFGALALLVLVLTPRMD